MTADPRPEFHEESWDAEIERLCLKHGFWRVMESVSRQWSGRDPHGALTVGPPGRSSRRDAWLAENAEKILEVLRFAEAGIVMASTHETYTSRQRDMARLDAIREIAQRQRMLSGNAGRN